VSTPAAPQSDNIFWSQPALSRKQRWSLLGVRGGTVWFTGLSGSGKSTISTALEAELLRRGRLAYRLDGDNIRHGLNANLGFSAEDRHENIRRIGEVSRLFADAGAIALVSFISPYRADRDQVRRIHERGIASSDAAASGASMGDLPFLEVFVDTPIEVCEQRDPKGLYKKARAGQLKGFTGIDDPYEAPIAPELVLRTATMGVPECVQACLKALTDRGVL
jgi:adenylylsulfate kinase